MGQAISAARDALKASDDAAAASARQNLEILHKMVDAQLDKYESPMTT